MTNEHNELLDDALRSLKESQGWADKSKWVKWKEAVQRAERSLRKLNSQLSDGIPPCSAQFAEQLVDATDRYCNCSEGSAHCALERSLLDHAIEILGMATLEALQRSAEIKFRKGQCSHDLRAAILATEIAIVAGRELNHKSLPTWENWLSWLRKERERQLKDLQPITITQLLKTKDNLLLEMLFKYLDARMQQSPLTEIGIIPLLTAEWRMIHSCFWLEGEVGNGGFGQYFENTGGNSAQNAADGYALIGANDYADMVNVALNAFHQNGGEAIEDNPELQNCDEFFGSPGNQKRLDKTRADYIRKNVDRFSELKF